MKALIHQSPEERLASNSEATLSAIENVVKSLENSNGDKSVLQKLEEVKSAMLVNNRLLKEIKPGVEKSGSASDFIDGFIKSIKGDKGDKGDSIKGEKGERGVMGHKGEKGEMGPRGFQGLKGEKGDGPQGVAGLKGERGDSGKDGSPDDADTIINKIHTSKLLIQPHRIQGLRDIIKVVDQIGKNPQGKLENVGGNNPLIIQDSTGARVSDYVTTLKLSTNITPTYSGDGVVTLTASGGGGGFTTLTATETPNGVKTVFTFSAATAQPSFIISDNVMMQATTKAGTVNWTWSAGPKQATMTIAPADDIVGIV